MIIVPIPCAFPCTFPYILFRRISIQSKIKIELKVDQPICFSIQQKIEAERHKCGEIFLCKTVHLQIFSSPIHHSEAKHQMSQSNHLIATVPQL